MAGWDRVDSGNAGDRNARVPPSKRHLEPRRIAANLASIEAVPEVLLSGADREWALMWARKGYDVYACRGEDGAWYLWLATRCVELGRVAPAVEQQAKHKNVRH